MDDTYVITDRVSQECKAIGRLCLLCPVVYFYLLNRLTFDLDMLRVLWITSDHS